MNMFIEAIGLIFLFVTLYRLITKDNIVKYIKFSKILYKTEIGDISIKELNIILS